MNNDLLRVFETESDYDSAKPDFVYPTVSYVRDVDEVKYMSKPLRNYFFIEALADGMAVTLDNTRQMPGMDFSITAPANELEYSTDQQIWKRLPSNTASPVINTNERIYLRGNATVGDAANDTLGIGFFNISQSCNVGGNIMSLLFNDDFEGKTDLTGYDGAFAGLFLQQPIVNTTQLILPATTLSMSCYNGMFQNCTSLTTAPELPATTLSVGCYNQMFNGCESLTTAPELPATTLASWCYGYMFSGCTSLTTPPRILPATTLTDYCYYYMFASCASLTTAPELLATTLTDECCHQMFAHCTSLTTPPRILPATTLANNCYEYMFLNCTSLTTAPELPATTLADGCYQSMFSNCTSLTTAPALPATTLANNCYRYMFMDCTLLTTAPELPATTLADSCYNAMFQRCSNLNNIKMLATDISATNCLTGWVGDVSSTGTFVKNPALSEATIGRGNSGIPNGWTVVDAE